MRDVNPAAGAWSWKRRIGMTLFSELATHSSVQPSKLWLEPQMYQSTQLTNPVYDNESPPNFLFNSHPQVRTARQKVHPSFNWMTGWLHRRCWIQKSFSISGMTRKEGSVHTARSTFQRSRGEPGSSRSNRRNPLVSNKKADLITLRPGNRNENGPSIIGWIEIRMRISTPVPTSSWMMSRRILPSSSTVEVMTSYAPKEYSLGL